jgi:hypothetical protein
MTLFVHETHRVRGRAEDEFEAAFRDENGWMDRLGRGDDARLLYFTVQAHGTGPSYRFTTITAVADGAAWERLATRVQSGDLHDWVTNVDTLRYDVTSKVLLPVAWAPLREVDLASVSSTPADHEPTLFMEDTGWPLVSIDEYVDYWGRDYFPLLDKQPAASRLLEIQACWTPAFGSGLRPEGILWQRVHSLDRLMKLFTTEQPPELKAPGTYMWDALNYRDSWQSRLLRTSAWSPLW